MVYEIQFNCRGQIGTKNISSRKKKEKRKKTRRRNLKAPLTFKNSRDQFTLKPILFHNSLIEFT